MAPETPTAARPTSLLVIRTDVCKAHEDSGPHPITAPRKLEFTTPTLELITTLINTAPDWIIERERFISECETERGKDLARRARNDTQPVGLRAPKCCVTQCIGRIFAIVFAKHRFFREHLVKSVTIYVTKQ